MKNNNDYVCGSRLDTDPAQLKSNITYLTEYVDGVIKSEAASIILKHNTYTSYCLTLLAYSTGHRPVIDMFAYREDIDLQENIVVINDKVCNSATRNRVCWFSSIANNQLRNYLKHLDSLAKSLHVTHNKSDTACTIYGLTDSINAYKQSIPLFFFLSRDLNIISITPTLLLKEIETAWPYTQDNHNRHYLESYLDRYGIPSSLIDLQTGHQRNNNHLLGITTSWTAAECASILKPALNSLTENQGWRALDGIKYKSDITIKKCHPKPSKEFGHILRSTIRKNNLEKLENKIKGIVLGEVTKNGGVEPYIQNIKHQEDTITTILSECVESENLSQNTIEIFINIINKMAKDNGISTLKSLHVFPVEPTPFHDGWLHQYATTRKLRKDFIKYLNTNSDKSKYSAEENWAEIVVSAVLFSGLFKYEWINYILEQGPSSLIKIKKWLYFIEIWTDKPEKDLNKEYQSPNWRWYPDPLSRHLILRCLQSKKTTFHRKVHKDKVLQHVSCILREIDFDSSKQKNSLKHLCTITEAYWIYHLPAFIYSIFQSKVETRPLPQRTLARLCYKKRLSAETPEKHIKIHISDPDNNSTNDRNLKEYLIIIRAAVNTANSKYRNNHPKQLSQLKVLILDAHRRNTFADISVILSQWLLHLIENGGSRGSPLTLNTINNYFFSIAKPLVIYIGYNRIEEYDEEAISDIYSKVINYNNTDQSTRAHQLFRFNLINSEYGITDFNELDWGAIAGKWLSRQETRVDSNIVTPEEYYRSLTLITKSNLDDYTKSWAATFLILGYRFGLRIGEAHHVRWQDIQRLNDLVIVQVQRTIQGRKKTPAAIRQIPLMGALNDLERKILEDHLDSISNKANFNIKSHIFHDPNNTSELLPRHIVWNVVHSVLRLITGDSRIRFQHLRHSFASGQCISNLINNAYLVGYESENNLWDSYQGCINRNLINPKKSSAYKMSSLSCSVGHTRFATTLHSYIHLADDITLGYASKAPFPEVSIQTLSEITGYKVSTLKSRIRTKKLNKTSFNAMDVLATIQIGEEIPAYNFELEKYPKRLKYDITKKSLTINDIYEILLSFGIHNCTHHNIAYTKCLEEKTVNNIISKAQNIEKKTSFYDFGLSDKCNSGWFPKPSISRISSINNEKNNVKILLIHIDKLLCNSAISRIMSNGVNSWINSVRIHSSGNVLVFNNADELTTFLEVSNLLGYKSTHFNYSYSRSLSEENKKQMLSELSLIGILNAKPEKIRRLENGMEDERLNFVKLTLNKSVSDSLPKKLASLNQLFFILSVNFSLFEK